MTKVGESKNSMKWNIPLKGLSTSVNTAEKFQPGTYLLTGKCGINHYNQYNKGGMAGFFF